MRRSISAIAIVCVLCAPATARADVALDWKAIAVTTMSSQTPFAQARFMAIVQLAVFEAVNAVNGGYEPYLGTIVAPDGASADAAAIVAAHRVLRYYFSGSGTALDLARANSLAAIPDGSAKSSGIATGEDAAMGMILSRDNDGSAPALFYLPESADAGVWQLTPSCPPAGGVFFQWRNVTPFGIPSVEPFLSDPPPALTSNRYTKDYLEVKTVGGLNSTERPQDRSDVARFFAMSSPSLLLNLAARQMSAAKGHSLSENAWALALLNMAINDSLIASFATKYHYNFWRPETAIRAGDMDDNPKTDLDLTYKPFITTPCFPSYPSNHVSGSSGGAEVLRRIYGAAGHALALSNPAIVGVTRYYTSLKGITDDVDDARVYGGIHFRFEQEAGGRLGRTVATYVYKHNLRRVNNPE